MRKLLFVIVLAAALLSIAAAMAQEGLDNATPGNATLANATPATGAAPEAAPGNATPANATSGNATPGNATSGNATPGNATSDNATPDNATAGNATPGVATPLPPALPDATPNATAPRIEGAFGYRLGDVWNGTSAPSEPGLLKADVDPLQDSGFFDFHSLWLDPESRRIVQISASRAYADAAQAEQALLALMGALTGKYGPPRQEGQRQVFGLEGRSVHVLASTEGDLALLGVVYQDDRAAAAALTRPRFELKLPDIPGVNGTGL